MSLALVRQCLGSKTEISERALKGRVAEDSPFIATREERQVVKSNQRFWEFFLLLKRVDSLGGR